jgi:hypothetical protein
LSQHFVIGIENGCTFVLIGVGELMLKSSINNITEGTLSDWRGDVGIGGVGKLEVERIGVNRSNGERRREDKPTNTEIAETRRGCCCWR